VGIEVHLHAKDFVGVAFTLDRTQVANLRDYLTYQLTRLKK
jgi:hypothetical protein